MGVSRSGGVIQMVALLAALVCLVSGCSEMRRRPPPLPALSQPGVRPVAGLADLLRSNLSGERDSLSRLATYMPAAGVGARALVGVGGTIYDLGLDASPGVSPARRLATICTGRMRVAADGRWLACEAEAGIGMVAIDPSPLDRGRLLIPLRASADPLAPAFLRDPVWAPDGWRLAVVSNQGDGCAIDFYETPPPHARARLIGRLSFTELVTHEAEHLVGCRLSSLDWSRDGRWLGLTVVQPAGYGSTYKLYALDLHALDPRPDTATAAGEADGNGPPPAFVSVTQSMLLDLGPTNSLFAWSPEAGVATTVTRDGRDIVRVALTGGSASALVAQDVASICALAWTPEGRRLVFSLCRPGSGDLSGPDAQLYTFERDADCRSPARGSCP